MLRLGTRHRVLPAGWVLLVSLLMGTAAAAPASDNPAQTLTQADTIRTSNHAEFITLMQRLDADAKKLAPEQQLYLRYLKAWELTYRGDYETVIPQLDAVIAGSTDPTLRFRAGVTAVSVLAIGTRYEEAFARLNSLLEQLPQVTDKAARRHGLAVAAQLYTDAGQYDLAKSYANQLLAEDQSGEGACNGWYYKLDALYRSGKLRADDQQLQDGIDTCVKAAEPLFANGIRIRMAGLEIQQGQSAAAIVLLQKYQAEVQYTHYRNQISQFDALLARAHWKEGELTQAQEFALDAVNSGIKGEYTEPLITAYQLLYLIAQKQGDLGTALAYHEKYMAADKGYLNNVSAKVLAYETVKQQVQEKRQQIDALNKQNQILTLQHTLGKKAAETSRLYIVLLLMVLASIVLWTYKIKRSQLRFMKLARRDGLTGIFNRQYFVDEAEQLLQYCRKSTRDACIVLIDLDHFKAVNDTHGHAVGDRVLRRAVEACQKHLRSTDIFGRLGGEEFGILLPDCTLEQALARAEQIRVAIAAVSGDDAPHIPVSASFGVSATARAGYELRELLMHADDGLYRAKREGRNRVVVISDDAEACLKTG